MLPDMNMIQDSPSQKGGEYVIYYCTNSDFLSISVSSSDNVSIDLYILIYSWADLSQLKFSLMDPWVTNLE